MYCSGLLDAAGEGAGQIRGEGLAPFDDGLDGGDLLVGVADLQGAVELVGDHLCGVDVAGL